MRISPRSTLNPAVTTAFAAALMGAGTASAAPSVFNFTDPGNRFAPASGTATLEYYDPFLSDWGPLATLFGKASGFGLPGMTGGDPDVMSFPACSNSEGYLLTHEAAPNGSYGTSLSLVSNYTLIYDVYYPAESDGQWRSFFQTSTSNGDDGEFFVQNTLSGGIGINSNYRGRVTPGQWHRIAFSVRAAPGEGQVQRYIDGQFVGAIGTTGSPLENRFGLDISALLLTDNDSETAPGYLSSFYFTDRAMPASEITALGGPHADGATVPGAPAPAYAEKMTRRVQAIGHRGGSFGSAPDNSLSALRQAFLDGAAGVEIDTRLTADGVAVCFHDASVERTTNGFGEVQNLTLAELQALDAGSNYGPEFAGEKVPSLAQALAEAKGKGIVYLDIKTAGQADAFATAVNATGFPLNDLWFWTPDDPGYAAEIRAALPGAQIFWGGPDATWKTDPAYFSGLRDIGVIGFSIGTGTGTPDLEFAARAKQEGFLVEVYTVNDPDSMLRAAAAGVDYIETDFPSTVVALNPVPLTKAGNPLPAGAASVTSPSVVLRWLTAQDTTAHRVHFGTANPPPFAVEQSSDLYQTPLLISGRTYYWRIDEITPSGTIIGDVWSFTTPPPANGTVQEWEFNGSLASSLGDGSLIFADGAGTESQVAFETTNGLDVPHPGGEPAAYLRIPALFDPAGGLALTLTGIPANGGGAFINRYTLVFDALLPFAPNWCCFFNTDPNNANDGDFFVNSSLAIGIGALGYSAAGVIQPGSWHRIVFSADLPAGTVTTYVDGVPVRTRTGGPLTDARFALATGGTGPHLRLFNDEDGETSEMLINAFAFTDVPLSASQVLDLGGVRSGGIFLTAPAVLPPVTIQHTGNTVTLTWDPAPSRGLQRATALSGWQDVPGTTGFSTFSETIVPGNRVFFRAAE